MDVLRTAPESSDFIPLAEHQSRTPSSFHSGPPVLHYHSQRCKLVLLEGDLEATPALKVLRDENASANGSDDSTAAVSAPADVAHDDGEAKEVAIDGVDTWVTSDKFLLYSPTTSAGVSIPYPSISLHAIQRLRLPGTDTEVKGLYMQIATPGAPGEEDEEEECITMTVVPSTEPSSVGGITATTEPLTQDPSETPEETSTQMLYAAVSACSNLHPDPVEPGDEEELDDGDKFLSEEEHANALFQAGLIATRQMNGGLPPPVDGSSGWITAENMHEFFDEEGNWIAGGEAPSFPLGSGAGTVRGRDLDEEDDGENGEAENDETKWRRTD